MCKVVPLVLLVCLGACVDGTVPEISPAPLIISNPLPAGSPMASGPLGSASITANVTDFVYISMMPGTIPGDAATIRNLRTGAFVTTTMILGGFDPVPLAAEVGDTIELVAKDMQGATVFIGFGTVTVRRPPVVVRTEPPPKKRDVPLNAVMLVVFSEPIDAGSISGAIQVWQNGQPVPGTATLSADPLRAEWRPDAPLAADADYELVISQGVTDQGGDHLAAATTVPFHTSATAGIVAFVGVQNGQTDIYRMVADGSAPEQLTHDAAVEWSPAWSPDGAKIAYLVVTAGSEGLYVMNADGSGQVRLVDRASTSGRVTWSHDGTKLVFGTSAVHLSVVNADGSGATQVTTDTSGVCCPEWAPDGSRIAYNELNQSSRTWDLYVVNPDGSDRTLLVRDGFLPAWSPDGARIAFRRDYHTGPDPIDWHAAIYVMNADGSGIGLAASEMAEAAWSPDGSMMAFAGVGLYVGRLDGSLPRRVTYTNAIRGGGAPRWSPDERLLTYEECGSVYCEILVISPDGVVYPDYSGAISVTRGQGATWAPKR